ncbi:MAG: protein kinase [Phycisphaerae bacterium]
MTPAQYEKIRGLYVKAADLPQEDRANFLMQHCHDREVRREVEALLDASQHTDFLETPALGKALPFETTPLEAPTHTAESADASDVAVEIPQSIGNYEILRLLGQGGMGTVYLAQQQNPRREVALKVMRAGTTTASMLRSFRHETEILGRLQHPGIAQIYEAGAAKTAAGTQPYFAMERIVGSTLTEYAREKHLSLRQRVELLARICDAVQHAHQKGVIHRDLKPANILVDASGQPRILDFGVARLADDDAATTAAQTHAGALIGTIPYMSPEQIAGGRNDLDTRSDVYSLGVVAFELLSGTLPHNVREKSVYEAARTIREEEPTRLASRNRALRGDLETIVATALEKDPERRYQSAAVLAGDLRRLLRFEPIVARPASTLYQLQKIARRHRAIFVGIAALSGALVLGAIGTGYGLIRARDSANLAAQEAERARESEKRANIEKDRARIAAARAVEVSSFLRGMMSAADPEKVAGVNLTVRDVLDEAAIRIRTQPPNDKTVAAMVYITLADTYRALGAMDTAESHLRDADNLLAAHVDIPADTRAEREHVWSRIRLDQGQYADALTHLDRELSLLTSLPHPDPTVVANCRVKRAEVFIDLGNFADAEREIQTILALRMDSVGAASPEYADARTLEARLHRAQARYEEARASIEAALAALLKSVDGEHPAVAKCQTELAGIYLDEGRPKEAVPLFANAVRIYRIAYGNEHHAIASALNNLAAAQARIGQVADAIENLSEAIRIYRKVLPQNV